MPLPDSFPASLVFVGGAPRSGTTVAHALLCTAPGASPYSPEISFFRYMVDAYWAGAGNWDLHTSGHFPDLEAFRSTMAGTAREVLVQSWRHLGEPRILCLKDPMLTPRFPELNALLPEALLVTVCRHPVDVVRSRQDVAERAGQPFGEADVRQVAQEFHDYYWTLFNHDFRGRNVFFRYEDINDAGVRAALATRMGVPGFDDEALWRTFNGQKRDFSEVSDQPTYSPKYSQAIDPAPRLDPLKPEWQEIVRQRCRAVMSRMRYA